jgi:hypothetical protein
LKGWRSDLDSKSKAKSTKFANGLTAVSRELIGPEKTKVDNNEFIFCVYNHDGKTEMFTHGLFSISRLIECVSSAIAVLTSDLIKGKTGEKQ